MPPKKDTDDDPVTTEYDVYITPSLAEQLYLLQFPTRSREQPYTVMYGNPPGEMRIKPGSGFMEMDVPLNTQMFYDTDKATEWGEALAKAQQAGAKGHGLAVGFSQGSRGGGVAQSTSAMDTDHLLKHQTLGGQLMKDEKGKPNYMIGTFLTDKRELHLTGLDGVVQMRPQFHHIDARTQNERNRTRRVDPDAAPKEAQQVQVTIVPGDVEDHAATTKALLDKAQDEPWKRMEYFDEERNEAFYSYNTRLFLNPELKGAELLSALDNEKYLEAISAPRLDQRGQPRVKPMTKRMKAQQTHEASDNEDVVDGQADGIETA